MSVKIKPTSQIIKRLNLEPNGAVQSYFTNRCYAYMDKFVPLGDTGDLRGVVDIKPDSITYQSSYASYQYKGMREDGTHVVKNYTTPGTGPYWDRRMVSANMKDIEKEIESKFGFGG